MGVHITDIMNVVYYEYHWMGQDWMETLTEIKQPTRWNNWLPKILIYCSLVSLNIMLLLMVLWGSVTSGYINRFLSHQ